MPATTVADLLLARAGDQHVGLRFEDRAWTWAQHVQCSADRAAALSSLRRADRPFHVGVLLDNVPEFSFLLGAAALSGAVLVGLNPIRRGHALARDVALADCQLVITEDRHASELHGVDLPVLNTDSPAWHQLIDGHADSTLIPARVTPDDLLMLIFTSGTSGDPKAVRCTHAKVTRPATMLRERFGLCGADTTYLAMPMFHSNAIMAGWAVGLAAGATLAVRRRFSASEFLADVRRFDVTYANYVGRPLSYILATEERPDDADNPLRWMYGNEAAERDITRFAERFGCVVMDGFGSTEGGVSIKRSPDAPTGALGRMPEGVVLLHPDTGQECAVAVCDAHGRLRNAETAVGELVNTAGAGAFSGYYGDPAADAERLRGGVYHSGDLAYRDADGFCYFVGRTGDWLRVDGENLGTAPIEGVLMRHHDVVEVAVYAVPDVGVGDQVMAALVLRGDARFDTEDFAEFLRAQTDLAVKQWPRFVRISTVLPKTATHKVVKRTLAAQQWSCADPVWWRPDRALRYALLSADDAAALNSALAVR